ncbi:PA14 domain-containing protein [Hymenobacter arizonensis]|uniref:Outer membrane protein OmpA n=1 Tax=Hymenobacter arizonensis TaxID=1227077 RepID=A0A1I5XE35_HYMAR|nr:PA14 domain-containing protein [Hymenobacter arizonensis]SFQ30235.1 Outer membrane protein OmpA [Hymenobacter arizonensis]
MKQYVFVWFLVGLTAGMPSVATAQAPVGEGLRGEYYAGIRFAQLTHARTDGPIDFDWAGAPPAPGVGSEQFTVRWSGWLVPPLTGRYVLHVEADDGVNLVLDERELVGGWRNRSLRAYRVPVLLQAGRPYALRLDYLQYTQRARVRLRWELPPSPAVLGSWRTLWGAAESPLLGEGTPVAPIPARYLFSNWPVAPKRPAAPMAYSPAGTRRVPAGSRPPPLRVALGEVRVKASRKTPSEPTTPYADTLAARLAKGQALTLRTLYFTQSKADLPIAVQASLDTLARALRRYPALRLEVQGHTDDQGDTLLNRQLSQRRAEAVCRYLAARGVPTASLRPVGRGGTQPIADNAVLTERPRNRRVVLRPVP